MLPPKPEKPRRGATREQKKAHEAAVAQWRKDADETGITIHDLRRSLAATMASANRNVSLVKAVMGHKDIKTTLAHYAHTDKDAQLNAKETAHAIWLEAAKEQAKKPAVKVEPITKASSKQKSRKP